MKNFGVNEVSNLRILGRTTKNRMPLTLFWTGSGIECNVKGGELWIEIEADYDIYEPWISVVINGAYISRQMLEKGRKWICLFRNMNSEVIKNVKVLKEVQAMPVDSAHCIQIHRFKTDGTFEQLEDKKCKIEFIGDSITSGEGSIGALQEQDWISMWFSTSNNYAVMTANALNADYHIISQSGWGVLSGWDNNPYSALPLYYDRVCGVLNGEKNKALGAYEKYDFASWQPDAIVINLGTNDSGAFNSPEWKDEVTGKVYKNRLNADGTYNQEDLNAIQNAMTAFLRQLRTCNPKSQIVWVYGMIGIPMEETILVAIKEYKEQTHDEAVSYLRLPDTTDETVGARCHPGIKAHEAAAKVLKEYLSKLLNS
ncbi:SGNH/GDSL hydrolase family protein [Cellulosilyticum ruminicola]|uniref:SGNH/GDSL hydrolase family protein n=1 Tax=Cellulosilyticum ruminicola TaxID=425254 RepID=UPI0006D2CA86|nr:SGNH/GDSL hydrolase family protein [Cellulosilyticum ruminicola]